MRRILTLLVLGLLVPLSLGAQQRPTPRRAELEARLQQRFVEQAATELGLDAGARDRLGEVVRQTAERRRLLALRGAEIRAGLLRATRDPATPAAEFERLLAELDTLRARELEAWREEQRALDRILTPRQRAQFIAARTRFNERLLEFRQNARGRRVPPGGAGGERD